MSLTPATLIIGTPQSTTAHALRLLQQKLCKNTNACGNCISCAQVQARQHHTIYWATPERSYTIDDAHTVLRISSFALAEKQQFFIILDKADMMNASAANALLKSIEEPSAGYNYILLAQCQDNVLPTIRSRCTLFRTHSEHEYTAHSDIIRVLRSPRALPLDQAIKIIDGAKLNEQQTTDVLNALLAQLLSAERELLDDTKRRTQLVNTRKHVVRFIEQPLAPGSSKLVLRTLFMQLHYSAQQIISQK